MKQSEVDYKRLDEPELEPVDELVGTDEPPHALVRSLAVDLGESLCV